MSRVIIFLLGLIIPVSTSSAAGIIETGKNILSWASHPINFVYLVLAYILMAVLAISSWLMGLWGKAFNSIWDASLQITQYSVISVGWGLTRDVLNMFFVVALLIIAFATILRIESYQYKVLLPKLIYAALLVNFSRTIATVLIDFSNVLMTTLLNLSKGSIAETFAQVIFGAGTGTIAKGPTFGSTDGFKVLNTVIVGYVITIILVVALSIAIAGLTLMMVVRSLMLMILIILSPVAFVLNILPVTAQYAKRWWDEFLKYTFYGPIAGFCVYLAVMLAKDVKEKIGAKSGLNLIQNQDQVYGLMKTDAFLGIVLVIAFLYMSIMIIRALSPMAAGMAMGLYQRGGRLAGKAAGWGAGWAGRRFSRSAALGNEGMVGKTLSRVGSLFQPVTLGRALAGDKAAQERIDRVGNMARFLSPRTVSEAWKQRQERLDRKAYGGGVGYVRNRMNNWFRDQDQTDYVKQEYRREVDEEAKALKERNPSMNSELLRSELKDTVGKKGQEAKQEAIIRALAGSGSINDLVNDPELSNMLHSKKFLSGRENKGNEEYYDPATGEKIDKTKRPEEWQMAHDSAKGYSYHTVQDIFKNMFGEQHGVQLMGDVNSSLKNNGDYTLDGSLAITPDGKTRFASHSKQAEGMASSLSKLSADKFDSLSRHSFAAESLDASGKVNDELKLQNGMKIFMQKHGPSADSVARIDRQMSLKTQQAIVRSKDEIIRQIGDLQKAGKHNIAKNIQDQYNAAAKNIEGAREITVIAASSASKGKDTGRPLGNSAFQKTDNE